MPLDPNANFLPTIAGLGAHPIIMGDLIGKEENDLLEKKKAQKAQEQAFERTISAPKVIPRTYSSQDLERKGMPGGEFVDVGGTWARRQDLPALAQSGNTEAFNKILQRQHEDALRKAAVMAPPVSGYVMNDVLPASAVGAFRNLITPGGGGGQALDDAGALRDTMAMRQANQARTDQARAAQRPTMDQTKAILMDAMGLGKAAEAADLARMQHGLREYELKVGDPRKEQKDLEKARIDADSRREIALLGAKSLQRAEDYKEMQEFLKVPRTAAEVAALKRAQAERANIYDASRVGGSPSVTTGKEPSGAPQPTDKSAPADVVSEEQKRIDAEAEGNALRTFLRESLGLAKDTDPVGTIDVNKISAAMAKRGASLKDAELEALVNKIRAAGGGENLIHSIVANYIRLSRAAGLDEGAGQWKIDDSKRGGAWTNEVALTNPTNPEFSGAKIGGTEASGMGTKTLGTLAGVGSMLLGGLGLGAGGAGLLRGLGYAVPVAPSGTAGATIGGLGGMFPGSRFGEWASGTEDLLPTFTTAGAERAKQEALQLERFLNLMLRKTYGKKG